MDPDKWYRVKELVAVALKLDPADQRRFILDQTQDDAEVRAEVESLLVDALNTPFLEDEALAWSEATLEGETVGHYKIIEKLGSGGMGLVYKAEDTRTGCVVALKSLPPRLVRDENAKKRFVREAKAATMIDHPNVARVDEVVVDEPYLFIIMEYVEGPTLHVLIRERGKIPLRQSVDYAMQIARGLQAAHEKRIIHRDVKSENVVVSHHDCIKILDFGIAKISGLSTMTDLKSTLGTAAYMSPEQACGFAVDSRTDVWSLGVVLYEMVSGRLPFKGANTLDVIGSILNDPHDPLHDGNHRLFRELSQIVDKTLAKSVDERYQTIDDLLEDLTAIADWAD